MLSSISPLGERARQQRFWVTATAYLIASTSAGAAVGGALGFAGSARPAGSDRVTLIALATLGIVGAFVDRAAFGVHVPGPRRQVNEDWLARYRGWVYGAGFGFQLGAAFVTIVTSSITYLAFAFALGARSTAVGLAIGATFGCIRALPVMTQRGLSSWDDLRLSLARLDRRRSLARRSAIVAQLALGSLTVAVAAAGVTGQ